MHQLRRLAAEFFQIDFKGIVGAVHLAAVMDEVLHLHIQDQRLVGILDIESVEAAALCDDRYVGLVAEPLYVLVVGRLRNN